MIKALVFTSVILVFTYSACEGLECYHCYSDLKHATYNKDMVKCNEKNLTASNTMICPDNSKCIYEVMKLPYMEPQIWRTCSDPKYEPCDKKSVPNGLEMLECTFCESDRCNLHKKTGENTFTININGTLEVLIG